MRICSLLPSITEVLFELGLGDDVVGVTHECDWPPAALQKPKLTSSRIAPDGGSSDEIDRQVREQPGSLYHLDVSLLTQLEPSIILTQSLCPVCAVDENAVRDIAVELPSRPAVFSYHPTCLAEVWQTVRDIAGVTGVSDRGRELLERLDRRIWAVRSAVAAVVERPRTVCLEWTNPPFACGHWTPELVELAGGVELLGMPGMPSRAVAWEDLLAADPDVLMIAPCGFTLERTRTEWPWLCSQPGWNSLRAVRAGRVYCADGSSYFNRPGPRLVDTLEILAEAIHPEVVSNLAPRGGFQRIAGPNS